MTICFFDIDGTLLLTGGAGQAAMEVALADAFPDGPPVEGIAYAGRTDRAIINDMLVFHGVDATDDRFNEFLEVYLENLPTNLERLTGRVLPGITELLDHLSQLEHIALGLLTGNNRRGAMLKVGHYGLDHHFPFGGFGDRHENRDDVAREAMTAASQHLSREIELDSVWVIGDTPADVTCARAIGAKAVAVATGSYTADQLRQTEPDYLFDDFADATQFVRLLEHN